jgi:uncharacterized protein (DUF302 family)
MCITFDIVLFILLSALIFHSSTGYANEIEGCSTKDHYSWRQRSNYSVGETLDRLTSYLNKEPGVRVFYRVNQKDIANEYDGNVEDVESMAFEKQQLATKILSANIEAAIALPIRATSWKDIDGKVWIQVSDICDINNRFHLRGAGGAVDAVSRLLSNWLAKSVDKDVIIAK